MRDFLNFYLDAPIDSLQSTSSIELPAEFADQILHKQVMSLDDLIEVIKQARAEEGIEGEVTLPEEMKIGYGLRFILPKCIESYKDCIVNQV